MRVYLYTVVNAAHSLSRFIRARIYLNDLITPKPLQPIKVNVASRTQSSTARCCGAGAFVLDRELNQRERHATPGGFRRTCYRSSLHIISSYVCALKWCGVAKESLHRWFLRAIRTDNWPPPMAFGLDLFSALGGHGLPLGPHSPRIITILFA